jgi:hypothetical protein
MVYTIVLHIKLNVDKRRTRATKSDSLGTKPALRAAVQPSKRYSERQSTPKRTEPKQSSLYKRTRATAQRSPNEMRAFERMQLGVEHSTV